MGSRIAIIDGHPDPDRGRFVHALADRYAEGAASAGHEVRRIEVAQLDFPLLRSGSDWAEGQVPSGLADAQAAIAWADHLVILYPLWLGDVPALLKGFLEQVARPGFAISKGSRGPGPVGLLKGKSARLVVTMGMPAFFYRFYFGSHSVKSLERNVLKFVGIKPVAHTLIGDVEGSAGARDQALATMFDLGAEAA